MFGVSRPPFIQDNPPSGISFELFSTIAGNLGWQFKPLFAPNARMEKAIEELTIDAIVETQQLNEKAFYSAPFIAYRNFAVSRTQSQLSFESYQSLAGYSVCAWQNASKHLGKLFSQNTSSFKDYKEFSHQEKQVKSWLSGECEVIIIDDTLLKWWINVLTPKFLELGRSLDLDIQFDPLPNNTLWWFVAFKDENLRDQFDLELKKLRASGEYDRIREKVTLQMPSPVNKTEN